MLNSTKMWLIPGTATLTLGGIAAAWELTSPDLTAMPLSQKIASSSESPAATIRTPLPLAPMSVPPPENPPRVNNGPPGNQAAQTLAARIGELATDVRLERRDSSWSPGAERFIDATIKEMIPVNATSVGSCGSRRCEFAVTGIRMSDLTIGPNDLSAALSRQMHSEFGAVRIFSSHPDAAGSFEMHAVLARSGYDVHGREATSHSRDADGSK